jgi:autotransporter-associated beta strand protein
MTGLRTLFIGGNNTYSGPTTVSSGALVFNANSSSSISTLSGTAPVTISANASVTSNALSLSTLSLNGSLQIRSNAATSQINSLTLAGSSNNWTGALNLSNNKLIVEDVTTHNTTLATLTNQAQFGLTHTAGIFSSVLAANQGLAVLDNAITHFTTFGGLPVDAGSILVAPELLGDTNADGHVDLTDLSTVLNNFGTANSAWTSGNFDGQSTIDLTDLSAVLNNFGLSNLNPSGTSSSAAAPIPEPSTMALLLPVAALLRRKRRSILQTRS